MSSTGVKKGPLILAWLLGLGAAAAMAFVLFEPIAAYDRLASGAYGFESAMRESLMRGRMREAGIPLIAGSVASVLTIGLAAVGARGRLAGRLASALGGIGLAGAAYVWVRYGDGILSAL